MTTDMQRMREEVLRALEEGSGRAGLEGLLGAQALTRVQSAVSRLRKSDFTVAVIGRQGVGKSTLINALLGRRVAPVDETETTNVVCSFRHAGAEGERALVYFQDGHVETAPVSDSGLRRFVDEQQNPRNELQVERIEVCIDAPLLTTGIVLVDTPGVASLTPTTERATMRFLPNIALGLFVVGTAPTLVATEARFLRVTWAHSRSFIFVQNSREGAAGEVEEARADNQRKLDEIAREEGGEPVKLVVVDADRALEGLRNTRPELVKQSGLEDLVDAIRSHVREGAERALVMADAAAIIFELRTAQRAADIRLQSLEAEHSASQSELEEEAARLREAEAKWRAAETNFMRQTEETIDRFEAQLHESLAAAKDAVTKLAQDRTLKADRLSDALMDRLTTAAHGPQVAIQRAFASHVEDLLDDAAGLFRALETLFRAERGMPEVAADLKGTERKEDVGKAITSVGSLGVTTLAGAAVWAAGGALMAGEGLAAAVAAAAGLVPGPGWVIAGAILAGGYVVKRAAQQRAVEALTKGIGDATASAEQQILQGVRAAYRDRRDQVLEVLAVRTRAALQEHRELLDCRRQDHRVSAEARGRLGDELRSNQTVLSQTLHRIEAVVTHVEGNAS